MKESHRKILVVSITAIILAAFFILTSNVSSGYLKELGGSLPIPVFTLIIGLVDGFNPCNLFVLTLLISLMLTESHSRKKILTVGFSFVGVVFVFYFIFMAAWLNIFRFIGFIDPLRIAIAVIAIVAGLINAKEFFAFRKGITLMIQDKHIGPLKKRINKVAHLLKKGSTATLITASIALAVFASLVELPCTAGFPIIYTGILSGLNLSGFSYYAYMLLYSLFYVVPLITIITVLGFAFKGKTISKSTMALIKFIGGAIMLLLGIVLLANPGLLGL